MCSILIVDDEEDVLEWARAHLSVVGHEVHSACNGEDALQFLAAHENDPPCLIVSDLRMPILDGWDLLNALKLDSRWAHLPVIVCSASILPDAAPPVLRAKAYWPRRPSKQVLDRIHEFCLRHHQSWPPLAGETATTKAAG